MPNRVRLALCIIKVARSHGIILQIALCQQRFVQLRTEPKALFCQFNSGLHQRSPGQFAMLFVGQLEHTQCAWNAHRKPTRNAIHEG